MTTASELHSQLVDLASDPAVAGLSFTGRYESLTGPTIMIDFNRTSQDIKDLFVNYLEDLEMLFMYLSNYYNVKLHERETLFILDEVQLCPKARAAIKYLVADGKYDYLKTGSLMTIKKNVKDILILSEERHIKMYPLEFMIRRTSWKHRLESSLRATEKGLMIFTLFHPK